MVENTTKIHKTAVALCIVAALLAVSFFAGFRQPSNVPPSGFHKFNVATATEDAQAAIKANDLRLFAINSYTIEVPGANENDLSTIQSDYGIKLIEGTSDALNGAEKRAFNDNARAYADKYNATVIAYKRSLNTRKQ